MELVMEAHGYCADWKAETENSPVNCFPAVVACDESNIQKYNMIRVSVFLFVLSVGREQPGDSIT